MSRCTTPLEWMKLMAETSFLVMLLASVSVKCFLRRMRPRSSPPVSNSITTYTWSWQHQSTNDSQLNTFHHRSATPSQRTHEADNTSQRTTVSLTHSPLLLLKWETSIGYSVQNTLARLTHTHTHDPPTTITNHLCIATIRAITYYKYYMLTTN